MGFSERPAGTMTHFVGFNLRLASSSAVKNRIQQHHAREGVQGGANVIRAGSRGSLTVVIYIVLHLAEERVDGRDKKRGGQGAPLKDTREDQVHDH